MGNNVTYIPVQTNHVLHLVLTLLTFGMWLPVWIVMAIVNTNRVKAYTPPVPASAIPPYNPYLNVKEGHTFLNDPAGERDGYRWCIRHMQWEPGTEHVSPVQSA